MIKNNILKGNIINDDTNGAMMYMIMVLSWYSIGLVFLLGMDMLSHSEEIEDSTRQRDEFCIENLRDHRNTQEILEELADKQNRHRLWHIYLGTTWNKKDCLTRAETIRIRHIEKQLAIIKRHRHSRNAPRYTRSYSEDRLTASQLPSKATLSSHLQRSTTAIPTTDDEQTNLIFFSSQCSRISRERAESDLLLLTSNINERQNPRISYLNFSQ